MLKVLTQEQVDHYFREGFLHVKNVYTPESIDRIREIMAKALTDGTWESAPHYNEGVTTDVFRVMPELVDLFFTEKYVQVFKDLFGDEMVVLPEPAIHRNRFYFWHKDSSFLDEQGEKYHWNDDFNAIMAAMYFQDNDDVYGGGITVAPGTHKDKEDKHHKVAHMNTFQRAFLKIQKILGISFYDDLEKHPKLTRVPSKKGDLVLLDIRIDHKGSTPKATRDDYDKFAYFNIVTDNSKYTKDLNRCLRARPSGYYSNYLKHDLELPASLVKKGKELDFKLDF